MASSNLIKDMEENFFLCPVCLDQLKEPKLLPCLHRYCSDCLKTVIQASHGGSIKCPMCKQHSKIPENGVDDFKTDFHMKSMLEFIQLQKSFENEDLKECVGCSKNKKVSAYCFKCREFLCDQCYTYHVSNKLFTDHQPHTLKLDNIEAKNITLEKLAALTEDPRCHIHVKKEAQLCCITCGTVPICLVCTYSKHKCHDLHDVAELANSERELLKPKVAELNKHKSKLYELPQKITSMTQKLKENVAKMTEILINQHKQQTVKIKDKLAERTTIRRWGTMNIDNRRKDETSQISLNLEEELSQVREKYDEIMETAQQKYDDESEEFKEKCDTIDAELVRKLGNLDGNLKNLTTTKELLTKQHETELKEISDYCEQIIKRYENFTSTTSSILAAKDEWTDCMCIPDIRAACDRLIAEMKKEMPVLESLSDIVVNDITQVIVDDVAITEHAEYVVDVVGIKAKGWLINGITSNKNGTIVITGSISGEYSHITVIKGKDEIQRQDKIKREKKYRLTPFRFCCSLSEFKIITVCFSDEIGIYDICVGSQSNMNIGDVIDSWPKYRCVCCVTNDPVNNYIIVGTDSRDVYVFDDQLKYSHTITLPDVSSHSCDITIHGGSLLVCDYIAKRAYAVTMGGSESTLIYEFTKPDLYDHGNWGPLNVCTDKNELIYILWAVRISNQTRCVLIQYSQDGRQILTTRPVDSDSCCITILQEGAVEKLLIATFVSGKLYTYGLVVT